MDINGPNILQHSHVTHNLGPNHRRVPRAHQHPPVPHPRRQRHDGRPQHRPHRQPRPPQHQPPDPVEHHQRRHDRRQRQEEVQRALVFREHRHAAVRDGLDEGYHGRGAVAGLREGLPLEDLDGGARVEDVCVDEGDDVGGEERCQELLHDRFVHGSLLLVLLL
ncbi:hypothetical protein CFAM422_002352 [Trichoderma lentiforme]|uniref:Uncharacterized protein n=1 Tax=Trichoderma lentiforme TaxID=1567552 RepID=A0A9P4XPF8_9HYPO|nr:hypothetical protein CFAM422_002352 [Trichoderma lentiforme]